MGLILPQTVKVRTSIKMCKYYREKGYEFEKCGDFIEVDVFDLPKGSTVKVKVVCDICGKKSEMWYRTVVKCNEKNELITCGSNSCINKKREDTCMKKYNTKNVAQSQKIQNKLKKTWQEKYGENITNPFQLEEIKNKIKETNLKKYGTEYALQNKEIQNKMRATNLERYGCESAIQNEKIKNKIKKTCMKRYGADNPFGSKEIQNKAKKTWQEKYGENITNPFQSEEIKNKIKETNLERYGCECTLQNKEIQNKSKETCMKKYGVDNPSKAKEIKDKKKVTCKERYGVEHALQNEEIKNKVLSSFQFNGTGPSSRAQRYINYILNGNLNRRICGSLVDIYMEKENIVIEHDGSGHFLGDKMNKEKGPTKESLLYEKEREDKIINKGYRMIRFIANKDRIPSDEVILNLIEGFKNSDFKVIRINFEEGTIDRDYEEKWYCNFGKLRNITQKDLEQFEKQEENISEN